MTKFIGSNMTITKKWSEASIQLTRQAIIDCFVAPDGVLHMKNIDGSYGRIKLENLIANRFLIEDKTDNAKHQFGTLDELIEGGWAID